MTLPNDLPTRIIRVGDAFQIADSLPARGSVVFCAGHVDASGILDKICDLRGSPLSIDCRLQVVNSRYELEKFLDGVDVGVKLFASTAVAFLGEFRPGDMDATWMTPARAIDPLDAVVARIPEGGAITVTADEDRVHPIATRISEWGGADFAGRNFILHADSEAYEQTMLEQGPPLPVLYDPEYPADRRRSGLDRAPIFPPGEAVAKVTTPGSVSASISRDRAPAAPAPVAPPERETFPERLDRMALIARKIRIAKRRLRRAAGTAELKAFVAGLPTGKRFAIVAGSQSHLLFVRELIQTSDRARELRPFVSYLHQVDIVDGSPIMSVVCTGMGGDAGDLLCIPAPGVAKTVERVQVRKAIAAIHAAHPAKPFALRVEDFPNQRPLPAPAFSNVVPEVVLPLPAPAPEFGLSEATRESIRKTLDGFMERLKAMGPIYPDVLRGESAAFWGGFPDYASLAQPIAPAPLTSLGPVYSECRDLVVYDGPFAAVEVPIPGVPAGPVPTEMVIGRADPRPERIGWVCPRCDDVLSPDVLRCEGCR